MIKTELTIINPAGIHTRPAAEIVKIASRYKSKIYLEIDGFTVNAKSIIGVMTLAGEQGTKVRVIADGEDETDAIESLKKLFEAGFYEM
ncbi:MAG: HPr family phosphocarrier protein [Candidatus Kapaibacteriales bacterium]